MSTMAYDVKNSTQKISFDLVEYMGSYKSFSGGGVKMVYWTIAIQWR